MRYTAQIEARPDGRYVAHTMVDTGAPISTPPDAAGYPAASDNARELVAAYGTTAAEAETALKAALLLRESPPAPITVTIETGI